jgi:hypothetical protein
MKVLLIATLAFITLGCSMQPKAISVQKMEISFIKQEAENGITIKKGLLKTNTVIVKNWPFQGTHCDQCTSIETNYFTPKGPEKRVEIYGKNKSLIAFSIESRSKTVKFNDFTVYFSEDKSIEVCNLEDCKSIQKFEELSLSNCVVMLTDYHYTAARKGIADSGRKIFQIAASCH